MAINKTTTETKNKIKANSVIALPNRPQIPAEQLKQAFVKPIVDTSNSMIQELDRIVEETNAEITDLDNDLQEQIDGIDDTLENKADLVDGKVPLEQLPDMEITKQKVEDVLTGNITSHNHATEIGNHDTSESAHTDIRQAITAIQTIIATIDGEPDADSVINKLHEIVALLNGYAEGTTLADLLSGKVDKIDGKGLTKNELTDVLVEAYNAAYTHSQSIHAPTNAQKNVQSDWNQTDNTKDDYIKNKPTIPTLRPTIELEVASLTTLTGAEKLAIRNKLIALIVDDKIDGTKFDDIVLVRTSDSIRLHYSSIDYCVANPQITVIFETESAKYILNVPLIDYTNSTLTSTSTYTKTEIDTMFDDLPTLRPTIELEVASFTTLTEHEKLTIKNQLSSLIVDDKIDGTKFDDIVLVSTSDLIRLHYSSIDYYAADSRITVIFETQDKKYKLFVSLLYSSHSTLTSTTTIIPLISTDITADATSDGKTASPKAIKTYVDNHNTSGTAHTNIRNAVAEAKAIAEGKSRAIVFATEADLNGWLATPPTFSRPDGKTKADLKIGDNLYIEELDKPDYWWNGTTIKELETQKVDLTEYAKTTDLPTKVSQLENDSEFLTEDDLPASMPPTEHNHDDRYYTESEVDTKLGGKANATHNHTTSEITDFPTSMPPTAHNHDSDYYKKSETYTKTQIDALVGELAGETQELKSITTEPTGSFVFGDLYYNSSTKGLYYYTGSAWELTGLGEPIPGVIYSFNGTLFFWNETEADLIQIGGGVDLSNYYTKTEIDAMFDNLLGGEY